MIGDTPKTLDSLTLGDDGQSIDDPPWTTDLLNGPCHLGVDALLYVNGWSNG